MPVGTSDDLRVKTSLTSPMFHALPASDQLLNNSVAMIKFTTLSEG